MTIEEILETFSDINFAYNNSSKYDTLKRMLEELQDTEVTYEQLKNYCRKRCLTIITNEAYETLIHRYNTQDTGYWIDRSNGGRILYPWMENGECCKCGSFGSRGWHFCPICGAKMEAK